MQEIKEPEEEEETINGAESYSTVVDQIVENDPQLSKIVTPVDDWTYWAK